MGGGRGVNAEKAGSRANSKKIPRNPQNQSGARLGQAAVAGCYT